MYEIIKRFRLAVVVGFALLVAASCKVNNKIVKAFRTEYEISNKLNLDSALLKSYLPYKSLLDQEMNRVVANAAVTLSKSNKLPESLMGNFFADALLFEGRKYDPSIDFAFPVTKGGLRCDWQKGPVSLSKVYELMPFENEMMVITINGEQVENLMSFIAVTRGQPIAGVRMKIIDKKARSIEINGAPFDKNKSYRVLTSDYIAGGGDNVESFKNSVESKVIGMKVRDAILRNITELQNKGIDINAKLDGRIIEN